MPTCLPYYSLLTIASAETSEFARTGQAQALSRSTSAPGKAIKLHCRSNQTDGVRIGPSHRPAEIHNGTGLAENSAKTEEDCAILAFGLPHCGTSIGGVGNGRRSLNMLGGGRKPESQSLLGPASLGRFGAATLGAQPRSQWVLCTPIGVLPGDPRPAKSGDHGKVIRDGAGGGGL